MRQATPKTQTVVASAVTSQCCEVSSFRFPSSHVSNENRFVRIASSARILI